MEKDVKERLLVHLKELHLPAFRRGYEELARQAQQEGLSFEQYLLGLAQRECQERRGAVRTKKAAVKLPGLSARAVLICFWLL